MSDIYLQITETPTVVTLSAPVISGALSSTVTVANVVTVALDSNSLSALENVTVTVGAAITGTVTVSSMPAVSGSVTLGAGTAQIGSVTASISGTVPVSISSVTVGNSVTIGNFPATQAVTFGQAIVSASNINGLNNSVGTDGGTPASTNFVKIGGHQDGSNSVEHIVHVSAGGSMKVDASDSTVTFGTIRGTVTVGNSVTISSLPSLVAGTAQIGVVTIGNIRRAGDNAISQLSTEAGSNYLQTVVMPGTSQIGSVTASISNSVTIGSLPAISGTVTANTFALQGTAVTTSNFTSTTASTVLANYNAGREVLTIFNEGAGNLHICAGATCTTIAYQVRLSAGDYYEVPNHQTTITHSAVFATAGTARVTEVS